MPVIEVKHLTKQFPQPEGGFLKAVDDVSFEVKEGEVFGLLGPNGAGKTTTLEIIEGIQKATKGEISVLGINPQKEVNKIKERIGVQLQASAYFDYLTLEEILKLFGTFYKKQMDPMKLLEIVDLTEKKKSLVRHLSGGQKQRFSICASLVNDPKIAFLDEPTTGLDPQARRNIWEFIQKINKEGKTVIITTHYMEEAQELCDRVGIMDAGRIRALDTPINLINQLDASGRIDFQVDQKVDLAELHKIEGVVKVEQMGHNKYHMRVGKVTETFPKLINWAKNKRINILDEEVTHADLEDVFLELTGKKLKE
ncbi:MAG: ABC transporter ATP-binding protein [Patescibacteria group bacterium]